jgi:hypothetical protein
MEAWRRQLSCYTDNAHDIARFQLIVTDGSLVITRRAGFLIVENNPLVVVTRLATHRSTAATNSAFDPVLHLGLDVADRVDTEPHTLRKKTSALHSP